MSKISLGPLLFHWDAEKRRDFYFRMADEADIDCVYVGEAVCSKREPLFEPYFNKVVERLKSAGKEVVISTLSLVTTEREIASIKKHRDEGFLIEANDVSCINTLSGHPFVIGPYINTFNEGTLDFLISKGAKRLVMPMELTSDAVGILASRDKKFETEVMVFGRQTLSVSMRCYHARVNGLNKDKCQFACGADVDGLPVDTIDGKKLFTINGIQVMSHGYVALLKEMAGLEKKGVKYFRLSPQNVDMAKVADIYRKTLKKKMAPKEAIEKLRKITKETPFINGYANAREGMAWK